jgi:hypothetical protein
MAACVQVQVAGGDAGGRGVRGSNGGCQRGANLNFATTVPPSQRSRPSDTRVTQLINDNYAIFVTLCLCLGYVAACLDQHLQHRILLTIMGTTACLALSMISSLSAFGRSIETIRYYVLFGIVFVGVASLYALPGYAAQRIWQRLVRV